MPNTDNQNWDFLIKPKTGWFDINLGELYRYRDLVYLFVKRDFVTFYKQTILGPIWYIIQPLVNTLVFTIIYLMTVFTVDLLYGLIDPRIRYS